MELSAASGRIAAIDCSFDRQSEHSAQARKISTNFSQHLFARQFLPAQPISTLVLFCHLELAWIQTPERNQSGALPFLDTWHLRAEITA